MITSSMWKQLNDANRSLTKFNTDMKVLEKNSNHFFLCLISLLVFFAQCGFAFLEAGSVRTKSTVNILLKNLLDTLVAGIAYWMLGWGFAFGHDKGNSFIGLNQFFGLGLPEDEYPEMVYQFVYAAAASTIVSGAIAERCSLVAYLIYCFAMSTIVYPPVAHWAWDEGKNVSVTGSWNVSVTGSWNTTEWVWDNTECCRRGNLSLNTKGQAFLVDNGIINNTTNVTFEGITFIKSFKGIECGQGAGFLNSNAYFSDFGGSGGIHLLGGTFSLVACYIIGARLGRFDADGKAVQMPGHSVPLAALGGFILIFGFLAANGGSQKQISSPGSGAEVGMIIINTLLGGCSGGLSVLLNSRLNGTTWSFLMTLNGALAGMVSLCAGCDSFEQYHSIIVGAGGGTCYLATHYWMLRYHLDDPLDAVGVHGAAGLWGLLIAPFLTRQHGTWLSVLWNFVGAFVIMLWGAFWAVALFYPMNYWGMLRIPEEMELRGIDMMKHGEAAYPANAWVEEQYRDSDEASLLPKHGEVEESSMWRVMKHYSNLRMERLRRTV